MAGPGNPSRLHGAGRAVAVIGSNTSIIQRSAVLGPPPSTRATVSVRWAVCESKTPTFVIFGTSWMLH